MSANRLSDPSRRFSFPQGKEDDMSLRNPLFWGYALLLGFVAVVTGEIVTFAMLGLILIALNNIHRTLQSIRDRLDRSGPGQEKAPEPAKSDPGVREEG
jgi:hypothetical protein